MALSRYLTLATGARTTDHLRHHTMGNISRTAWHIPFLPLPWRFDVPSAAICKYLHVPLRRKKLSCVVPSGLTNPTHRAVRFQKVKRKHDYVP